MTGALVTQVYFFENEAHYRRNKCKGHINMVRIVQSILRLRKKFMPCTMQVINQCNHYDTQHFRTALISFGDVETWKVSLVNNKNETERVIKYMWRQALHELSVTTCIARSILLAPYVTLVNEYHIICVAAKRYWNVPASEAYGRYLSYRTNLLNTIIRKYGIPQKYT